MRRLDLLILDVCLMCFATLIAFALRENFEFRPIGCLKP